MRPSMNRNCIFLTLICLCIAFLSGCAVTDAEDFSQTNSPIERVTISPVEMSPSSTFVETDNNTSIHFGQTSLSDAIDAYNYMLQKQYPSEFNVLALVPASGSQTTFHPQDEAIAVSFRTNQDDRVVSLTMSMPLQYAYVNQTVFMEISGLLSLITQSEPDQIQIVSIHQIDSWNQFRLMLDESDTFTDVSFEHAYMAGDVRYLFRTEEDFLLFEMSPITSLDESNSTNDSSTTQASVPGTDERKEAASSHFYNAGNYTIGVDIDAGIYYVRSISSAQAASILICADGSGTPESEIYRDVVNTFTFVDLVEGRIVKVQGAEFARSEDVPALVQPNNGQWGEGKYRIGTDIPAGTYTLVAHSPDQLAYWARLSGANNTEGNTLSSDHFKENTRITVKAGEYLELLRCALLPNS